MTTKGRILWRAMIACILRGQDTYRRRLTSIVIQILSQRWRWKHYDTKGCEESKKQTKFTNEKTATIVYNSFPTSMGKIKTVCLT